MMMNTLIKIVFLFSSFLCLSQNDIVSSGGEASSENGSFSYSVGQILISQIDPPSSSWSDEAITINHGVQQFFIPRCQNNENIKISASPNPSKGLVNVELSNWDDIGVNLSVYDVLGRSILSQPLSKNKTQLNLTELNSGIYLISINNVCGGVSTFKLIISNNK